MDGGELLSIRVRDEPTRTWVTAVGELDLASAAAFEQHLWDAQARTGWVVLDLRALTFIDCSGLRSVVAGQRRATEEEHRFEVLCGPGQVWRMLSLSGFDQLLDVIGRPVPAAITGRLAMEAAA